MSLIRPALVTFTLMTIVTGALYPLAMTAVAQLLFPEQANGGLLVREGKLIGSALIGQQFKQPKYFWGRLSATRPTAYQASASSGSNLGPLNTDLRTAAKQRLDALRVADPHAAERLPVDLVTASGSGLDPHISPAAAYYQAGRVAHERGLTVASVRTLIDRHIEERAFGFLGEPRINVLLLNLALDEGATQPK